MKPRTVTFLGLLRSLFVAGGCLGLWGSPAFTLAEVAQEANHHVSVEAFANQMRGSYQTGTFQALWVDEERAEITTADPNDKRHLLVQVWYPAVFEGNPPRVPYVLSRELYPTEGALEDWLNTVRHVVTTSVLDARTALAPARFPVLIYQPGGVNPHFSATFQTEFLASHGYVVVAIGRPDWFRMRDSGNPFPGGYVYRRDLEWDRIPFPAPRSPNWPGVMEENLKDVSFVLDRLQLLDAETGSRFQGRLDLERIGALGWSAGGNMAIFAASFDPRIKASVNLDNLRVGGTIPEKVRGPILFLHGDMRWEREHLRGAVSREAWVKNRNFFTQYYARSDADWYDVTLSDAMHEHFSDRTLFRPVQQGQMPARQAHTIINRFTLEFFDKYLRASQSTPLLDGDESLVGVELFKGRGVRK